MNIIFDENIKNILEKKLKEQNKSAVRLMVKGFG